MTAAEIVRELREAAARLPRPMRRPMPPSLAASNAELDRAERESFVERVRLLVETWDGKS